LVLLCRRESSWSRLIFPRALGADRNVWPWASFLARLYSFPTNDSIAVLESGLDVRKVVTDGLPAEKFLEGFEIMRRGESGKIVLDWDADQA
jgi:hypothetical protein